MYLLIYCIIYVEEESIHYANFDSEYAMNLFIKKFKEDEEEIGIKFHVIKKYKIEKKID